MILVCSRDASVFADIPVHGCGYVGRDWDFLNPSPGWSDPYPDLRPNLQLQAFHKWLDEGRGGLCPIELEHESEFLIPCPECQLVGAVNQLKPEDLYQIDRIQWKKASRLLGEELGFCPLPIVPAPHHLRICNEHEGGCGYVGPCDDFRIHPDGEAGGICPACGRAPSDFLSIGLSRKFFFGQVTAESWQHVSALLGELEGACFIPGPNQRFGFRDMQDWDQSLCDQEEKLRLTCERSRDEG